MTDRAPIGDFAVRVVVAIALVALAALVWRLHDVVLLLFAAILVSVVLHAAADGVRRIVPVPGGAAVPLAGLLIVGGLAGAGTLFGHEIGQQLSGLGDALPGAWQRFTAWVGEERVAALVEGMSPDGSTIASMAQSAFGTISGSLTGFILAVLGGVYLAADPGKYRRGALRMLPRRAQPPAGEAMTATGKALRNWLFGQLISMAATFLAVFAGLSFVGVPSALALAIVAGLLEFIPLVGPFLGAIPALLIALLGGVEMFLWTAGFFVLWQQIEGNALAPLVMRYAVSIPPAVTLFSLFMFGGVFGIMGVILGGPLTVATWVMVKRLWVDRREHAETTAS